MEERYAGIEGFSTSEDLFRDGEEEISSWNKMATLLNIYFYMVDIQINEG